LVGNERKTRRGPLRDALPVVEASQETRVAQFSQSRPGPTARVAVDGNVAVLAAGEIHRRPNHIGRGVPKGGFTVEGGETFHERGVGNVPAFPLGQGSHVHNRVKGDALLNQGLKRHGIQFDNGKVHLLLLRLRRHAKQQRHGAANSNPVDPHHPDDEGQRSKVDSSKRTERVLGMGPKMAGRKEDGSCYRLHLKLSNNKMH